MHTVELCFFKSNGELARPFVTFSVAPHKVREVIEDASRLGKWAPVAVLLDGNAVTEIIIDAECVKFRGQPVVWF